MSESYGAAEKAAEQELVITRMFDAPREEVFEAWTSPESVMRWWGPKTFTTPICEIDFRPGGVFQSCMRSPEGRDYCGKGVYREIVEPERIVYTDAFADSDGNLVPAAYYDMSGEWPLEMLVTVAFEEEGDRTKLTLRHSGIPAGENQEMARAGWSESFDKLDEYLAEIGEMKKAA
jgi:uncharacterized protein YndB with AHSA1/START domain